MSLLRRVRMYNSLRSSGLDVQLWHVGLAGRRNGEVIRLPPQAASLIVWSALATQNFERRFVPEDGVGAAGELRPQSASLNLFGHVLRLDPASPAQRAMDMYFRPGRRLRGRPRTCLPTALAADLKKADLSFRSLTDLQHMRQLASDRDAWTALVKRLAPKAAGGDAE